MDVDESASQSSQFINFFDVSSQFPWQEPRAEQIHSRRSLMNGLLIFDILLNSGGILNPHAMYPPHNSEELQSLLDAIESSNYDTLKKDCLVYFLLKWYQDGRESSFQQQRCIPPQFAALADAYWHLDTGINIPKAVALLSDSRLNRDYASKIIHTISLSADSGELVRRYVETAKPQLVDPPDLEAYALALAESSVMEAWQFFCTFNETDPIRTRLFERILVWAVTPTPRPVALKQLLLLPFSKADESTLFSFALQPPETLEFPEVAIIQDLICVRLIQAGRYSDAIKLDRQFTSVTSSNNIGITKDRSNMVNEVYNALPAVERSLLDLELSTKQKVPLPPKPVSPELRRPATKPTDISLSQSWEDITMPDALVNKSTPLRQVRQPLITPVFGASPHTPNSRGAPIIPLNFSGTASGSRAVPRKSLPLSSSLHGSSHLLSSSLSGVGNRMAFAANSTVTSPASGIKVVTPNATPSHASVATTTFVSADRQQNAFYQPPPSRTNGVKRAFEDITPRSPENLNISDDIAVNDAEMETETSIRIEAHGNRRTKNGTILESAEDDENVLEYSVFSTKGSKPEKPKKKALEKEPPGSFMLDNDHDDDAMDEGQEDDSKLRKRGTRTGSRQLAKPPAKKARQTKEVKKFPGSLLEDEFEEEEEDDVAPLRAPSPKRPVRKSRSSASVEMSDEFESIQTRRRSSRLTMGGSTHGGSPEPPVPKVKKATRASGRKKR